MSIVEPSAEPRPRYDEEIRLIAQIVKQADRSVRPSALLLILWGGIAALNDLCFYIYYWRYFVIGHAAAPRSLVDWTPVGYLLLLGVSIGALFMQRTSARMTVVDRQLAVTFTVAASIAFIINTIGYPRWVMAGPDYAMLGNALFAVPTLSIGIQYRCVPLIAGGVALVASLLVPAFDPWNVNLYTCIGMVFGLLVPGVYFAVRRHA